MKIITSVTIGIKSIKNIDNPVHHITEDNINGLMILVNNCMVEGNRNNNTQIATLHPSLWLHELLDKYWENINYVTSVPKFEISKVIGSTITLKEYVVQNINIDEEQLEEFFKSSKYQSFVIYSITKNIDLITLTSKYLIRYADITEQDKIRDNKLKEIIA